MSGESDERAPVPYREFKKQNEKLQTARGRIEDLEQQLASIEDLRTQAGQVPQLKQQLADMTSKLEQQGAQHQEQISLLGLGNELGVNLANRQSMAILRAAYEADDSEGKPESLLDYVKGFKGDEETGPQIPSYLQGFRFDGSGTPPTGDQGGDPSRKPPRSRRMPTGGSPTTQQVDALWAKYQASRSDEDLKAYRVASEALRQGAGNR